jgi:hypothetical protein
MQLARKISLCLIAVLIGILPIGVAAIGSISHTALATEREIHLSRHLAIQLASLTSPDSDPRHPADWPRVWAAALDRELGEYLLQLSVNANYS